ncbi:hypothetical protein [Zhongshania sp. BJYM1]|uniref:hypothetical protein n=1 Tax=Zhongshania aquatica TaxID=2965069 RepID=UPI0022B57F04|nr:hypothetical protein [Marortus sp. BJYM1]
MPEGVWQVIIAAVISNTVVLGALGFLFKSLIGHFLDKDVNSYKSKLEATNLRMNISFGGIYAEQAKALSSLYKHMLELELYAESIREPSEWNEYRDKIRAAANHYHTVRIYIPESMDNLILNVITAAHGVLTQSLDGHTPSEFVKKFREAKESALVAMRRLMSVEEYSS